MRSSGFKWIIKAGDLKDADLRNSPIVLAYNGASHYVPTTLISPEEFADWNMQCVANLCQASLDILQGVSGEDVHVPGKFDYVIQLEIELKKAVEVLRSKDPDIVRKAKRAVGSVPTSNKPVGPLFSPPRPEAHPGGHPPAAAGTQAQSPPDVPESAQEEEGEQPVQRKKSTGKVYPCEVRGCSVECRRPSALIDHEWDKHGIGQPIVCNLGSCVNKSFSGWSNLRAHVKGQHQGDFTYTCKKHNFGTMAKAQWAQHWFKEHKGEGAHKDVDMDQETECGKCGKQFTSYAGLRQHQLRVECTLEKNFLCEHHAPKPKYFKTKEARDEHIQKYHPEMLAMDQEPIQLLPCDECDEMLGSASALKIHKNRHAAAKFFKDAARVAGTQSEHGKSATAQAQKEAAAEVIEVQDDDAPVPGTQAKVN